MSSRPVAPSERVAAIDIVRGFALLGIFIMNMPGFNSSAFAGADGSHLFPAWYDRGTEQVRELLFSGKFNSMFSFLFAVGFTIQMQRLREQGNVGANGIYLRRLLVLLAIGLVHYLLIWFGDVLHIYALFGLLLILGLDKLRDRSIWVLIGIAMVLPTVISILLLGDKGPEYWEAQLTVAKSFELSNNQAFGHGSFLDAVSENFRVAVFSYSDAESLRNYFGFYMQLMTTMLLGLLAGRHRWIQDHEKHAASVNRIQLWSIPVGVVTGVISLVARQLSDPLAVHVLDFVGGVAYKLCRIALMAFYMATILRLLRSPRWQARLAWIGTAGRMPLSNYLMQTLMGLTIFYGWGLGFWMQAGPLASLLLAVALFFLVQLPLSAWWLARNRYGPMEWLWRKLTYGRSLSAGNPAAAA